LAKRLFFFGERKESRERERERERERMKWGLNGKRRVSQPSQLLGHLEG
jgi:hypothetical protein